MAELPWRLVTVDIDGTLTLGHGWRPIAKAFGRLPVFEESNRRFYAREIGEDEHLADLLGIATGHTVAEVEQLVRATPKLRGIREGVVRLKELGARVALLSHNPPYVTSFYREEFGFDDDEGVDAQTVSRGRIGPPVGVRADKIQGLRKLLYRAGTDSGHTVHVGDGWADVPVFRAVGGGVALNASLPDVQAAADLVLETDDFRAVADAIRDLARRG